VRAIVKRYCSAWTLLLTTVWLSPAQAEPILTAWAFSGPFEIPTRSGEFNGLLLVASEQPFTGSAGFIDDVGVFSTDTTASGAYGAVSYRLVAIGDANRWIFADAAYANGTLEVPSNALTVSCGSAGDLWWAGQESRTDCTVTEYQDYVFDGQFNDFAGPDMIVRSSLTGDVTLTATPVANISEPNTVALVVPALLGLIVRGRRTLRRELTLQQLRSDTSMGRRI